MKENFLEFEITGCLFTGNKEVTLDELISEFMDFCDSKGWEFNGFIKPLEVNMSIKEVEKKMMETYSKYPLVGDYDVNPDIFKPEILELIRFSIEDED